MLHFDIKFTIVLFANTVFNAIPSEVTVIQLQNKLGVISCFFKVNA